MKNSDLQKYLKDLPDDYDVVLSGVAIIPDDSDSSDSIVVFDIPIVGIVQSNEEHGEIRFLFDSEHFETLDEIEQNLKEIKFNN